jgi:HEAT repeat protein
MANLFRNIDRISFWMGFVAATLLWWLLGRYRPLLARLWASLKEKSQATRYERSLSDEIRLGNDTLRMLQRWHLAAVFFSLDEILVTPRLLAPVVPPMAYEPTASEDITDWAIPFTPDWPELASFYGAPWLTVDEILQGGANLAIIGQPGAGKTVALAHLAAQIIRKDPQASQPTNFVPILVHAADLALPAVRLEEPLSVLLPALFTFVNSIPAKRLPGVIQLLFQRERALLLIDGLDELSPPALEQVTAFLESLFQKYPNLRSVVTADPDNLGRLPSLGFQSVPVVTWGQAQRALFISRWSDLWNRYLTGPMKTKSLPVDPLLMVGWLLNNTANLTPLETTLKVWGAFAGDALGPAAIAAIEAHIRRMMAGQPAKNRAALEQLAGQMVLNLQPLSERKIAEAWLGGKEAFIGEVEVKPESQAQGESPDAAGKVARTRASGALPDLLDCGLMISHPNDRVSICHPVLAGYLAAQALASANAGSQVARQPDWSGKTTSLQTLAILDTRATWINEIISEVDNDPLQRGLLSVARWLRNTPEGLPWISNIMRQLVLGLQDENMPLGFKARATSALVLSNNSGLPLLLRQLVAAPSPGLRQMGALGLGMLRDAKAINELIHLLEDQAPGVYRAAILALIALGDKTGLETVASILLAGNDSQRRAAAEGLANHPEEGYPTLEEGSTLDDPAVRRAVVFGLARTRLPWAYKLLEKMRNEDAQWVVQDAANQVLQAFDGHHPRLPRKLPPLTHTAWLIAFAAESGMGVAPGKPAYEMLYKALKEGNEDQRLAALYYLAERGEESAIMPLYQVYYASAGELHERTYDALWNLAASGIKLPPPIQFGLH